MKRVGIVARPDRAEAAEVVAGLVEWLLKRGREPVLDRATARLVPALGTAVAARSDLPGQVDLIVILGGDGTLLSMARVIGGLGVPILGVNLGGLGFLTATTLEELFPALDAVFAGEVVLDDRMLLATRVLRGGEQVRHYVALNDVVITKAAMSRIINLSVSVEGQYATAYRADGLIIATPTGSTAYSLSAGGPILFPVMDAVVITPICPHTLTDRPVVLPGGQQIEVTLLSDQDVMLTVDGQEGLALRHHDRVEVCRADARVRLIRFPQKHFFSVLRAKLKWGER